MSIAQKSDKTPCMNRIQVLNSQGSQCSSQFGDLCDALDFRVVVLVLEASAFDSMGLHLVVVVGADGVDVFPGCELLEELLGVVKLEDFLDAVKVLADVVLVLEDSKCSVDLPLHL